MSKHIRTLYLYIVSFVTLCMVVGSFIGIVNTTVAYIYPNVNYYGGVYPMSDSSVVSSGTNVTTTSSTAIENEKKAVEEYKKGLANEELMQKTRSLKSIFGAIAVLVVSVPLFIYHFGKIEKERKEEGVA